MIKPKLLTLRRRLPALLLALALLLSLTACGTDGSITGEDVPEAVRTAESVAELLTDAEETAESPAETAEAPPETAAEETEAPSSAEAGDPSLPDEDGTYTTRDEVALYIHLYGHLPQNFITKKQAQALGWEGGSLEPYAPGKCIGGSTFGNYEGLLPEKDGRVYTECDIDTLGADRRGAKRIVFSNDGLIYYTDDHYETFTLLYGEDAE